MAQRRRYTSWQIQSGLAESSASAAKEGRRVGFTVGAILAVLAVIAGILGLFVTGHLPTGKLNDLFAASQAASSADGNSEAERAWQAQLDVIYADATRVADSMAQLERSIEEACSQQNGSARVEQLAQLRAEQVAAVAENREKVAGLRVALRGSAHGRLVDSEKVAGADDVLKSMEETLAFEAHFLDATNGLDAANEIARSGDGAAMAAFYEPAWASFGLLEIIDAPACMEAACSEYASVYERLATYLYEASEMERTSELETRSMAEAIDWANGSAAVAQARISRIAAAQYAYAAQLLGGEANDQSAVEVSYTAVETISPNLYPSSPSVAELIVCSPFAQDVVLQAEIAGFTQPYTSKVHLERGANFFMVHPEMLTGLSAADLENGRKAQLDVRLENASGAVLEAQSTSVELLGLYDFNWANDALGDAAQMELLAWLQPDSSQIQEVLRRAADYMGEWTDGEFAEIAGYQYGNDWYPTLLQVAAVQKAVSDGGVLYVANSYSARADQHILTPTSALNNKQALCIEDCLIIASALLVADMHPLIVVTPGHAQVAVETSLGSGQYLLIETSTLPYDGVDLDIDYTDPDCYGGLVPLPGTPGGDFDWLGTGGSSATWTDYLASVEDGSDSYGGIYSLDCGMLRIIDLDGLQSL